LIFERLSGNLAKLPPKYAQSKKANDRKKDQQKRDSDNPVEHMISRKPNAT
jgi:phage portal protein BeeE